MVLNVNRNHSAYKGWEVSNLVFYVQQGMGRRGEGGMEVGERR